MQPIESTPPIPLKHDGETRIYTATRRDASRWRSESLSLSAFFGRLARPQRTAETAEQYRSMPKSEQDTIKDVGGFVGGLLKGGRRQKSAVANRTLLTLDADYAGEGFLSDVRERLSGVCWAVYSTHKHTERRPRYRLVIPLAEPCAVDQYEPALRKIAEKLDIDRFDDTTYDVNRLMYWPSCPSDGDFVFEHNDAPLLNVEDVLALYGDDGAWRDTTLWPISSRESGNFAQRLSRQQNPLEKKGVVGAWCRTLDVHAAIAEYLCDIYKRESDDRYSYLGGSTVSGLVIYEDGRFAYSNHGTDPAHGQLCNSFDLVRLHKFGHLDDESAANTPTHRLASYRAMVDFARSRRDVKTELTRSQMEDVGALFDDESSEEPIDTEWMAELQVSDSGAVKPTFVNAVIILTHDPKIRDMAHFNELSGRTEHGRTGREWSNGDSLVVRDYIGRKYVVDFPAQKIEDAIERRAMDLAFHPVREYLESLEWDGIPRVDSLFVDWCGAEDNEYIREAARCWVLAAVWRVYSPGYKFDHVPVLAAPQGKGKTSFIHIMARRRWYAELSCFDPKIAMEETQGAWLVELNEMGASNKSELEQQKAFISAQSTRVRMAYARRPSEFLRQFVLIGTTNETEYLKDHTGNRRWWPIDCGDMPFDLDGLEAIADQVWAEAVMRAHIIGEEPHMSDAAMEIAWRQQADKLESDDWTGVIAQWLDTEVRTDRYDKDFDDSATGARLVERDRVCVAEIATDCLRIPLDRLDRRVRLRIARVMDAMPGWERADRPKFGERFGRQKGWVRTVPF